MQSTLEFKDQTIPILFKEDNIQFLLLNTSWSVDEFFPGRSSINKAGFSIGLKGADEQIKHSGSNESILRVAVGHHPLTGNDKIKDDAFVELLQKDRFKIYMHGHVHEPKKELLFHYDPERIHIIGSGSFGAPAYDRPESVPLVYNLAKLERDCGKVRVYTRSKNRVGGAWGPHSIWSTGSSTSNESYYDIDLAEKSRQLQ